MNACLNGRKDLIQFLIKHYGEIMDANTMDLNGRTALQYSYNNICLLDDLIPLLHPRDKKDPFGMTPLHFAYLYKNFKDEIRETANVGELVLSILLSIPCHDDQNTKDQFGMLPNEIIPLPFELTNQDQILRQDHIFAIDINEEDVIQSIVNKFLKINLEIDE